MEDVIDAIHRCPSLPGYDKAICDREIGYFEKNKVRMRYADFRKRGFFVGSGVLEAGCRTVIGQAAEAVGNAHGQSGERIASSPCAAAS